MASLNRKLIMSNTKSVKNSKNTKRMQRKDMGRFFIHMTIIKIKQKDVKKSLSMSRMKWVFDDWSTLTLIRW